MRKYDWYILDKKNDRALIITEKVIDDRRYHTQENDFTWETCDLRRYLNEEFYDSFNVIDRKQIIEIVNVNNDNTWYGTSGGNATTDKIFLLSLDDVVKYFRDSGKLKERNRNPGWDWTKEEYLSWLDDQYNFERCAVDDANKICWWRLRTPGARNYLGSAVFDNAGDGYDDGGAISGSGGEYLSEDGYFLYKPGGLTGWEDAAQP